MLSKCKYKIDSALVLDLEKFDQYLLLKAVFCKALPYFNIDEPIYMYSLGSPKH